MWSQRDTPAMGPPKNQKGVRVWTGTRLIELESHEFVSRRLALFGCARPTASPRVAYGQRSPVLSDIHGRSRGGRRSGRI